MNAGLPPEVKTPKPPLLVLLQFVEAPAQGTELFSVGVRPSFEVVPVMSLNTQVVLVGFPLVP